MRSQLADELSKLDTRSFSNLGEVGKRCRALILGAELHHELQKSILEGYRSLQEKYGPELSVAVRSSATAEDLPTASFAGQQESFLNVKGRENLIGACHRCYASLFTDRAIKYRVDKGFDHMKVALSVGVQLMVRSDKACSGVMFTLDPDSGFEKVVLISGAWGLGENVVQGTVNTDEFLVYKPFVDQVSNPIISHRLGSKEWMMVLDETADFITSGKAVVNRETPPEKRSQFILRDEEIIQLARWAAYIEKHYGRPMDIEWAKDGITHQLFIVQARPETVHSQKTHQPAFFTEYRLIKRGNLLCRGIGLGNRIVSGKAKILSEPSQIDQLREGEILVTGRTDPDWDPVLKKASAIVTDQGGRTSHAAIVAREMGAIAVVGTGDATRKIQNGQLITVSTAEGDTGYVYEGEAQWEEKVIELSNIKMPETKVMFILGHPDKAFKYAALPNNGVGLMRMEFIINNSIGVHPMALHAFDAVQDKALRQIIEDKCRGYPNKEDYFITRLAEAIARIAAAFYPKDVIVRMSDFKSNEYANLIGGNLFEPAEENPMIGFRGASRYYHPLYRDAFKMECSAMKKAREDMGFTNVKLMIPFCRTVQEAIKVIQLMEEMGMKRGDKGLEIYMMAEIPSNAILAEDFAPYFDGFSIGSNDLTQLVLGADRDSELLSEIFSPFDPAVMQLIAMIIRKAKKAGIKTGLCGQAPSDYPEYAAFLVECGIDSISFNADALLRGIENILKAEEKIKKVSHSA
ncbi:MAG: phosphoenolpyruvate synthase [Chitinophagales bacterium]|nr:MAG: phosphoenolpyruvate synthase [Chitinophagales bacterium]